jgi:phosphatidylserine/phosphatidylglycerophosphate/cardiolipin synthase-like enzyme
MHNKFLVRVGAADHAEAVLTGSANFTSEGLSVQANLLHAFESPELAELYLQRKRYLDENPSLAATQRAEEGWSPNIRVGDASVRVYFPPESTDTRNSLDTVVNAVRSAQHSVLLCAFDPTDGPLLQAVFEKAAENRMVRALVNRVPSSEPQGDASRADVAAKIEIWKQSQKGHVVGFEAFKNKGVPPDFLPEKILWPGEDPKIMVRVHHKFVVIDGESDHPTVFTGSANFSGDSLHKNDENLLEITDCPRLARMYFAEFMRLYEHYRARFAFGRRAAGDQTAFILTKDSAWCRKYFVAGSAEENARVTIAG